LQKPYLVFTGKQFVLQLHCTPQGSGAHQPEAKIVVPVVGIVVVTNRRLSVLSGIVPAPAAFNAVSATNF
jgi:hypothetical protein